MNVQMMEGLLGASSNIKLSGTPMSVYRQASAEGDTEKMKRALGYTGECTEKAVKYQEKLDKGMKAEAKAEKEKAELEQEAAIEAATGGALSRPIDLFLARVLLNDLAWRWDFGGFRQQAARLAEFLIAAGPEVMTEYTIFLEEAGKKCRN